MHRMIITKFGGIQGIRDEGILESALAAPFITFDEIDFYPSIIEKAARLGYGLASNHAFIDGNKRTGAHVMLVFLRLNDIHLNYLKNDFTDIFLKIASNQANFDDLLNWINNHLE